MSIVFLLLAGFLAAAVALAGIVILIIALTRRTTRSSGARPPRITSGLVPAWDATAFPDVPALDPTASVLAGTSMHHPGPPAMDTSPPPPPPEPSPSPSSSLSPPIDCSPGTFDPGTGGCDYGTSSPSSPSSPGGGGE